MSTATKKPSEVQLPDLEKAAQVEQQLFAEAYFTKLASLGFAPTTPEEAQAYLGLAEKALVLAEHPAVKQAELARSPVLQLNAQLEKFMVDSGLQKQAAFEQQSAQLNQAALAYASIPEVYSAVLSLNTQAQ